MLQMSIKQPAKHGVIVDVISERSRSIDQGGIASIDVTSKLRSSPCFSCPARAM